LDSNRKEFKGLWAIVLGGSSGFGLAAIEKLARHGMNFAVLFREMAAGEKIVREKLAALAVKCNVTIAPFNINALDAEARSSFIQQFSQLTGQQPCVRLLLHSIARGNLKPLVGEDSLSADDIQLTSYAMSTSLLDWTKDLLKANLFYADARIIGLTSEGATKYLDNYAAVSIAKASLQSIVTYMSVELSKYGLRTNLIQAGVTETPSLKKIPGSEKLIAFAKKRNPMGRITQPADVANVIYLLCLDESAWINGSLIHVDGGEHCR
jgi:NAD(P)-dependent dehydrogenase (short-subunit alcohol dehydrogenase family)